MDLKLYFRRVQFLNPISCKNIPVCNFLWVYYFAKADVTKYHRLGGFNNRNLLSHSSGARSSRSRCLQSWFLMGVVRENLLHTSPQLLVVRLRHWVPWLIDLFSSLHGILLVRMAVCGSKFPLFIRTLVILD